MKSLLIVIWLFVGMTAAARAEAQLSFISCSTQIYLRADVGISPAQQESLSFDCAPSPGLYTSLDASDILDGPNAFASAASNGSIDRSWDVFAGGFIFQATARGTFRLRAGCGQVGGCGFPGIVAFADTLSRHTVILILSEPMTYEISAFGDNGNVRLETGIGYSEVVYASPQSGDLDNATGLLMPGNYRLYAQVGRISETLVRSIEGPVAGVDFFGEAQYLVELPEPGTVVSIGVAGVGLGALCGRRLRRRTRQ